MLMKNKTIENLGITKIESADNRKMSARLIQKQSTEEKLSLPPEIIFDELYRMD